MKRFLPQPRAALLPLALLVSVSQTGYGADAEQLQPYIAKVLERAGIITRDPVESEANTRAALSSADGDAMATARVNEAGTTAANSLDRAEPAPGPEVAGLVVVFADAQARALSRQNLPPPAALIDALERAAELPLNFKRAMSMDAFVFTFDAALSWQDYSALQARLQGLDSIAAFYPDTVQAPSMTPNDPFYYYQWSLLPTDRYSEALEDFAVGINAVDAWDLVPAGSGATTVAVLDSGLTDPHPIELWRVLPGYDFISNPDRARDGDGRDADPTDMGDYRGANECEENRDERASTWHGTKIASLIASRGDDGEGIAGIDWWADVLPVRVLGKCGGVVSDVVDGLLWAAGLPVPGVPDNEHPARIINMSFGRSYPEACLPLYATAVDALKNKDVLLIAAAGNDDEDAALFAPATCDGVLAVSAVDHQGDRAGYSNWNNNGELFIAAPGGDVLAHGFSGGILAGHDEGDKRPTGKLVYTYSGGTSMAAAHVSGVASLALSMDPAQRGEVVAAVMRSAVQPFPAGTECAKKKPLCGPGIVDAPATIEGVMELKPYSIVVEFYQEDLQHYFRTGNWDEIDLVREGRFGAWDETADYFLGWRNQSEFGVLPVCRFYGTPGVGPNSHFYTVDRNECEKVKKDPGWTYEGIAFYSRKPGISGECPQDTQPVYRYYNMGWEENDSNHRFATHLNDQAEMEAAGWVLEGVAMCSPN